MNNSGLLVLVLALVLGAGAWFLFAQSTDDLDPDITGVVTGNDVSARDVHVADATSNKQRSNADESMARTK